MGDCNVSYRAKTDSEMTLQRKAIAATAAGTCKPQRMTPLRLCIKAFLLPPANFNTLLPIWPSSGSCASRIKYYIDGGGEGVGLGFAHQPTMIEGGEKAVKAVRG